jgi:hypothetical protein
LESHLVVFPKSQSGLYHTIYGQALESSFSGLRLRTDAAKRYKKVENAAAVIWKMLLLAEQRFHRLNAPEKLMQVYLDTRFRERNEETETKQGEVLAIAWHLHTF